MKKILTMVAVAIMTATGAQAQSYDYGTKHEVAVSIGLDSNSQWIDVLEKMPPSSSSQAPRRSSKTNALSAPSQPSISTA